MGYSEQGTKVYEMFRKYLEKRGFAFHAHDDDLVLALTVHGDDLPQPTLVRVLDDRDVVQITSPLPSFIPEDKRIDAAVAVVTANYGMINGCFDLDMNDGEISYRVAQSYKGIEISDELIDYIMNMTFVVTDRYNDRFFMLGKGVLSLERFMEMENEE